MSMRENESGRRVARTGGHHQGLIVRLSAEDNERVGHCWMEGRLKDGDLAMAIEQSGDCFWDYQLLEKDAVGYRLIKESEFSAYVLGKKHEYQPSPREVRLLLAGESVALEARPLEDQA
jgi:hypothetical protein